MRNSNDYQEISKSQGNKQIISNQNQIYEKQKKSGNEIMQLKSQQCYKQEQLQDQALIQYYIFEDYQNLINLIYSLQTVIDYFKDDPNNEMVVLCKNKVISQLNLSNTIHQDIQETYKDQNYKQLINKEKQKVKEMISRLPPNVQNSIYLQMYNKNSLSENIRDSYQKLEQMNFTPNFNNQVVSKIFSSMQLIDEKVNHIKSQKNYIVPSHNDVLEKAKQYQNYTQQKLEASFPQRFSQSLISVPQQKQLQSRRSQSCKNLPQKYQQQIETQLQQQQKQQQSNKNHQKDKQHLKGYINLANY